MEQRTREHNKRRKRWGPPEDGGMKGTVRRKDRRQREETERAHFRQMDEEWPKEERSSKRWGENGVSRGKTERWGEENEGNIKGEVRWWEGSADWREGRSEETLQQREREVKVNRLWGKEGNGGEGEKIDIPSLICYMEDNKQIYTLHWQMSPIKPLQKKREGQHEKMKEMGKMRKENK